MKAGKLKTIVLRVQRFSQRSSQNKFGGLGFGGGLHWIWSYFTV